ncbi:MAG: sugar phosphate isomerase/epimerase family protein [Candidatus Limnocylindrales bacterium]
MRLELGINTCFAVKRWPLPADWAPIVAGQLGLRLVEHSLDLVDVDVDEQAPASQSAAIASAAREHGLTVRSTFTGLAAYSSNLLLSPDPAARWRARAWFGRAIGFSGSIGAIATGGHVGAFSVDDWGHPAARSARWEDLRAALHGLASDARAHGQEAFLVENLAAAREPSTMAMIQDLVTEGDTERVPIRLALDVGHMCVPGTSGADRDPYAWLTELGRAAFEVQLQQSDAEGDHHWPFTPAANARGRIEADRVIDALGESGVEELALILEIIPAFEQEDAAVLDDLRASVDYWLEAMTRRGVLAF